MLASHVKNQYDTISVLKKVLFQTRHMTGTKQKAYVLIRAIPKDGSLEKGGIYSAVGNEMMLLFELNFRT